VDRIEIYQVFMESWSGNSMNYYTTFTTREVAKRAVEIIERVTDRRAEVRTCYLYSSIEDHPLLGDRLKELHQPI
jgi:hypothetical protein